jgi:transcription elongation factor GreA
LEQIPVTTEGYEALKKDFERLKTIERPENIKAIETARAHGDLSENAEYHAAKERQSFIEGRIGELGYKIGNARSLIRPVLVRMWSGLQAGFCLRILIPKKELNT